jgi:hypothetical protein
MKILALVHNATDLDDISDYVTKISSAQDSVCLLNIIPVHGDIPTKMNGQVLDMCTEFDLSMYYNEKRENEAWMKKTTLTSVCESHSVIGSRLPIITDYVKNHEIDVILTNTEATNELRDFFKKTKAGRIFDEMDVPVLAFKCERINDQVKDIAILSDFNDPAAYNLEIVKNLAQKSAANITLFGFSDSSSAEEMLEQKMETFLESHGLENCKKVILPSNNKAKSTQELLFEYPINLLVLLDINRIGMKKILKGDLASDILNHTLVPILAY